MAAKHKFHLQTKRAVAVVQYFDGFKTIKYKTCRVVRIHDVTHRDTFTFECFVVNIYCKVLN